MYSKKMIGVALLLLILNCGGCEGEPDSDKNSSGEVIQSERVVPQVSKEADMARVEREVSQKVKEAEAVRTLQRENQREIEAEKISNMDRPQTEPK